MAVPPDINFEVQHGRSAGIASPSSRLLGTSLSRSALARCGLEGRTPVRHFGDAPGDDFLWITFKRERAEIRIQIPESGTQGARVITATYSTRAP